MGCDQGLEVRHSSRCYPSEFFTQISDMVRFTAAKDNPSGKVQDFLKSVEVFLGPLPYTVRQYLTREMTSAVTSI